MDKFWPSLIAIFTTVSIGCYNSSESVNKNTHSENTHSNQPGDQQPANAAQPNKEGEVAESQPDTAQGYIQAMQSELGDRAEAKLADIEAAIKQGKSGHERFPQDDNLTQALASIMYRSIRFLEKQPDELSGAPARTRRDGKSIDSKTGVSRAAR